MRECGVAGTANRNVIGSMNDFAVAVRYRLYGRESLPLVALALEFARTPCRPLEWASRLSRHTGAGALELGAVQ
jgi:hypothetical protein